MAYILPQTRVFQELRLAAEVDLQERSACIIGPDAALFRYSESSEKALIGLGQYNSAADTCYSWPQKPVGSTIDTSYTKLYIDNALLRYHRDQTDTLIKTAANKVRSPNTSWIDNPADPTNYPRSSSLLDRDVKVGDTVYITGSTGSAVKTLCTYVQDIEADTVAAVIGSATADSDNASSQLADTEWRQISGADNCITITAVQGGDYDGLEDGDITEIYTVTVTKGSSGGDATTATLKITSASGHDDVAAVTPSDFGVATAIGTRGLYVIWDEANSLSSSCSTDATDDGVSSNDFIIGQKWEIIVAQPFTAPTVSSAGSVYTGTTNKTYIVEVTVGGAFADSPKITVRTDNGTDTSGPTTVTASGSAVAVGTEGVVITFTGSALCKGDVYTINATAEKPGAYKTLVLGHSLDSEIPENDAATAELDLSLFIKKNVVFTENRTHAAPLKNFTQSDTEICVESGLQAFDSTWTDDGVEQALDIVTVSNCASTNQMYVEYRAWTSSLTDTVRSISDVSELDLAFEGPTTPDNPLKYATFKALQNSNGQEVRYLAVDDPDSVASWTSALDIVEDRSDVYGLVPLTRNQTVLDLFESHVNAQSTELVNRWRVLWVNVKVDEEAAVVSSSTSSDGEAVKATIEDDPNTSGTQYTLVRVTTANANLVEDGVRAGDELRIAYATDGFGNVSYDSYVIDAVLGEDSLRLVTGPDSAINTAEKIEIWHSRNKEELSEAISLSSGNWANRRIRSVWPDTIDVGVETVEGYYLCAALAGLVSGVVPQQGLTNLEIRGFDAAPRTTKMFNRSQLDSMAGNGTWIVTQDPRSGVIYTRHAVTTGDSDDINQREELATRKLDTISYYLYQRFSPYIGISNNVPSMLDIVEAETKAGIQFLRTAYFTPRLGGVIEDASIVDLRRSLEFKDRQLLMLSVELGYPLNNIDTYLLV